jgi:aldose 1-epimerase
MGPVKDTFGTTIEGIVVDRYTVANAGIEMQCLTYGGIISRLVVPDRRGRPEEVALGFDDLAQYERESPYFGAIIGRYANRIADARLHLDGVVYPLAANEAPHHLHGGNRGFDKQVWEARPYSSGSEIGVVFSRISPAGEEGYPGELFAQVTYRLTGQQELIIDYSAATSATTVVNLTQHTYFNLSGNLTSSIVDHVLTIRAGHYLPVDPRLIPNGTLEEVQGTPFDFREPRAIGERLGEPSVQLENAGGYDHTWVLDDAGNSDEPAAWLYDPGSGRRLAVSTTEPGIQVYSGTRLKVASKVPGRRYSARGGICLEAQHFPNSPAYPHFPSTVLRPGEPFASRTVWQFSAD